MPDRFGRFSANPAAGAGQASGGRLVGSLNSLARQQLKRYKRVRRLKPARQKTQLTGGEGIAFGATRLVP